MDICFLCGEPIEDEAAYTLIGLSHGDEDACEMVPAHAACLSKLPGPDPLAGLEIRGAPKSGESRVKWGQRGARRATSRQYAAAEFHKPLCCRASLAVHKAANGLGVRTTRLRRPQSRAVRLSARLASTASRTNVRDDRDTPLFVSAECFWICRCFG
jgi:hypothetical protein